MEIIEWFRFGIAALLIICGLIVEIIAVIGIHRFKYVLNRMHSAALGDTLALGLICIGIIIGCGINFTSFKIILVLLSIMLTSPVSSHLIAKMEIQTNEKVKEECEVLD